MAKEFIMKPKVDFCFKELMEDEMIRRGFLASILNIRPEEVVKTELLPTHLRKEHADDKLGILDVRVILNDNIQIDMEIQVAPFDLWPERSLFYLAKIYVGQLHEGEDYDKLKKCIHAEYSILNCFQMIQNIIHSFIFGKTVDAENIRISLRYIFSSCRS